MNTRNGYGYMVLDYYVEKLRARTAERATRLRAIRNRKDAETYRDTVRAKIRNAFGPWPGKTPLNARVTGIVHRSRYTIEKVIFESRPGCLVTANLYLPKNLRHPAPGVIGTCGHYNTGKAAAIYQAFPQRLAQAGFVVLIYDPLNQGERDQYYHLPRRHLVRNNCCVAHNLMGKQLHLVGEPFCSWRAWDGRRALDYLLSRPEVDARRIGVTGHSGGGTLTSWLWAVEDRFTMSAPSCFVTHFLSNLENELPADAEQYPPGILGHGIELGDFFIARAPKPVILLGAYHDFFDRRGLIKIANELKRFYAFFGAERKARLFIGVGGHNYAPDCQEQMVRFFCRQAGLPTPSRAARLVEEKPKTLFATPQGQVIPAGATPIHKLIAAKADALAARRRPLSRSALVRRLATLLNLPPRTGVPHHRILNPEARNGLLCGRYAIETEGSIRAILRKYVSTGFIRCPVSAKPLVTLYLPHESAETDAAKERLMKTLLKHKPVYTLDVRGIGESAPDSAPTPTARWYGMEYMLHGHGFMFGESLLGRRVHDVLSTLDLLADEGANEVILYGRGQGALLALFAALLHPIVKKVVLKNAPLSCREWIQTPVVAWPTASCVVGLLKAFDLPDAYRVLGKRLTLIEPWDAGMKPLTGHALADALRRAGLSHRLLA